MGNKIGRRKPVVDERYTRPQGLYQHRNVDHKKLRKLILDSKLAPCYPGDEECVLDFEECPICFLYYPSLNRSRCCLKGICTECFLRMKPQQPVRPTQYPFHIRSDSLEELEYISFDLVLRLNQEMILNLLRCPFCKTSNYAVEYRGVRTKEEKGMDQIEEQRVIEAQIRMRQQELRDEEERTQRKHEMISSGRMSCPSEIEYEEPSLRYPTESTELLSPQDSCLVPASRSKFISRQNRDNNFDMDLEEIMVMEAIWLSIQEHGVQRNPGCGTSALPKPSMSNACGNSRAVAHTEASLTLADQLLMREDSTHQMGDRDPYCDIIQRSSSTPVASDQLAESYPTESWTNVSLVNQPEALAVEENAWPLDHESEIAEAGTSYACSDTTSDTGPDALTLPVVNIISGHPLPDSFEEQMMLAMAVSLAEVRAKTSPQRPTWM